MSETNPSSRDNVLIETPPPLVPEAVPALLLAPFACCWCCCCFSTTSPCRPFGSIMPDRVICCWVAPAPARIGITTEGESGPDESSLSAPLDIGDRPSWNESRETRKSTTSVIVVIRQPAVANKRQKTTGSLIVHFKHDHGMRRPPIDCRDLAQTVVQCRHCGCHTTPHSLLRNLEWRSTSKPGISNARFCYRFSFC